MRLMMILLLLATGACAADSHSALSQEAHEQVKLGMSLNTAKAALESAEFRCGKPSPLATTPFGALCTRTRAHRIVGSCVQQVDLIATSDGGTITDIQALPPACTGL